MEKITIQFKGKDIEVTPVQPGVVKKTETIFYVQDSVSKEWLYCSPKRLADLLKKYNNDLAGYVGRNTRAQLKGEAKEAVAPAAEAPADEVPAVEAPAAV
jgi:hypothetical protein